MGCHFLLQGVFPTQGLNPGLLHCRQTLYHLSPQGSSQLYGGVNSNLLQEVLYHPQVYCTQSPCPCGSPLLIRTSSGDAQTQFCLSLCGVPGSWCAQGLFMPSEHLWQEWGLILNTNSPLLPSCWDFSFALGRGVSPHSRSSTYRLTGVSVTLDMGYLFMASPAKHSRSS